MSKQVTYALGVENVPTTEFDGRLGTQFAREANVA